MSNDAKSVLSLVLGMIALAAGLLFSLQGAGIVHWPPSSEMIDQRDWIERGIVVMLIGLALIATAWRIRR
jgi:hypothetical protein